MYIECGLPAVGGANVQTGSGLPPRAREDVALYTKAHRAQD